MDAGFVMRRFIRNLQAFMDLVDQLRTSVRVLRIRRRYKHRIKLLIRDIETYNDIYDWLKEKIPNYHERVIAIWNDNGSTVIYHGNMMIVPRTLCGEFLFMDKEMAVMFSLCFNERVSC